MAAQGQRPLVLMILDEFSISLSLGYNRASKNSMELLRVNYIQFGAIAVIHQEVLGTQTELKSHLSEF